ncbi:unnamed protein product, partial [Durusdinium trenchii]
WGSHASMRAHLDDQASGSLQGGIPSTYLTARNLDLCSVCGLTACQRKQGGWQLATVADRNSMTAWAELCMLPKAVLRPPPRGGAHRQLQTCAFTQRRCARWLEGERHELWEINRRGGPPVAFAPAVRTAMMTLMSPSTLGGKPVAWPWLQRGNFLGLALRLLTRFFWKKKAVVLAALRAKHPTAAPARPSLLGSGPCPAGSTPDFSVEDVVRAARSFRCGSAAGPSGLRGEHLREALDSAHDDEVAAHLTRVAQLLARGEAPLELAQHLAGATLHALPKGADDIGVAVPLGSEAAVHCSRHWVHANRSNPNKVFLKLDFANAFNTVDRAALLREVRLRLPALSPWAEWCYSHHTKLLFQGEVLTSEAGVQQGDPLGDCAAVSAAVGRLVNAARQLGLQLNASKCELTTLNGPQTNLDPSLFPAGFQVNDTGEFVLLGAAVGSPGFCHQHTLQRAEKTKPLLQALSKLADSQTALLLLRHCASWSKLVYSCRVTPPPFHQDALQSYDAAVLQCLELCCSGPLTPSACIQASLSTKTGGLGLRSVVRHSGAAYTASVLATLGTCSLILQQYSPSLDAIISNLNGTLLAADHVPFPPPPSLRQQDLSRAVDRNTAVQLASALSGPGHEAARAHLQLLQEPGAGAWLQALPCAALGLHVDSALFRIMVRLRLRLQLHSEDAPCRFCDGVCDTYGDHARVCPCGGDRTKRMALGRGMAAALQMCTSRTGAFGGPAAFDLAVTSGLRTGATAGSAQEGGRSAADYEARKRAHQQTEASCDAAGIQFVPLVAEACAGGWAPTAVATWKQVARAVAGRAGDSASVLVDRLQQSLSLTLQRENARAILRRAGDNPSAGALHFDTP